MNAVLVIDKPAGLTAHDVVHRVRKILQQKSVGHLGTLDPIATGVLPMVAGSFTRLAQFYLRSEKTYEGEIQFGFSTDTFDAQGEPTSAKQTVTSGLEDVRMAAQKFVGSISQMPPRFSAKKVSGVPAYKLARKGQTVELKPVEVTVHHFEILSLGDGVGRFLASVSAGTYIRSLIHDLGQALGWGAHLKSLRRTKAAEFEISQAVSLEVLADAVARGSLADHLIHPRTLLKDFPNVIAAEESAIRIRHGNAANLADFSMAREVKVFDREGQLISIARRVAGTLFQPHVVFVR